MLMLDALTLRADALCHTLARTVEISRAGAFRLPFEAVRRCCKC
jgi:hypothetical protein